MNQKGMTLVEVVVSGIVGAVIAGGILAILAAQGLAVNAGMANGRMQLQAIALSEAIGRKVRSSNLILDQAETWTPNPSGFSPSTSSDIRIYSSAGTLTAAYKIENSILKESTDGTNWTPFRIGANNVTVNPQSRFIIPADRKSIAIDFEITTTYRGKTFSLPLTGDVHRCRS